MSTTQRMTARRHPITRQAVAAFQSVSREDLHRALELRPWQPSPLDTTEAEPPAWCHGTSWASYWRTSFDLRQKLLAKTQTQPAKRAGN